MTRETWLASLKRYCSSTVEVKEKNGGYDLSLYCDFCTARLHAMHMNSRCDPQQASKRLQAIGWRLSNRIACPKHRGERKEQTVENVVVPHPANVDKPSGQERIEATEKAKRAKRECISILEDVFNVEKGCYAPGENDESVGRTVGLSPQAVKFIREEFFGSIKRPPELDDIFSQIDALKETQANDAKEFTARVAANTVAIDELKRRVELIARRYG